MVRRLPFGFFCDPTPRLVLFTFPLMATLPSETSHSSSSLPYAFPAPPAVSELPFLFVRCWGFFFDFFPLSVTFILILLTYFVKKCPLLPRLVSSLSYIYSRFGRNRGSPSHKLVGALLFLHVSFFVILHSLYATIHLLSFALSCSPASHIVFPKVLTFESSRRCQYCVAPTFSLPPHRMFAVISQFSLSACPPPRIWTETLVY